MSGEATALTPIDLALLRSTLPKVAAAWVLQLDLQVVEARRGEVVMTLPMSAPLVHSGGVLCGQALMAAADTAMILVFGEVHIQGDDGVRAAHATTTYALL